MDSHLDECPLEIIECQYHEVGCDSKFPRKDQNKHNKQNAEDHLVLTQQDLSDTKEQLASALGRITPLEVCLHQSLTGSGRSITVAGARWSIHLSALAATSSAGNQSVPVVMKIFPKKCRNVSFYTSPFYTHNGGYKMQLLVYPYRWNGGSHLSVFLCLMSGPFDDQLRWPLKQTFQIVLMNQIGNYDHHSTTVNDHTPSQSGGRVTHINPSGGWGAQSFITLDDFYKATPTRQFFKDNCAFLKVVSLP